jgi:hypothetical protein
MKNFFIDKNGKRITKNDHVHHEAKTSAKFEDRRGLVLQIFDSTATVWFYDTRVSETVNLADLTRPVY